MSEFDFKELEELQSLYFSSATLKKRIVKMLSKSTQCKAILESVNHDTGEYRIVLQGTLENK
ncbi:MAG: hypothetical protein ACE5HO_13925 [bacterium]